MKHRVFIALGSNLGDRARNLQAGIDALHPAVEVRAASPIYETDPWGYADQPAFLNQVVEGDTGLNPKALLAALKSIEIDLGRRPTFRYGPREIDLDLLLYDDWILDMDEIVIPHPGLSERAFVLLPLADLAPDLLHPTLGRSISELLSEIDASGVRPFEPREP